MYIITDNDFHNPDFDVALSLVFHFLLKNIYEQQRIITDQTKVDLDNHEILIIFLMFFLLALISEMSFIR